MHTAAKGTRKTEPQSLEKQRHSAALRCALTAGSLQQTQASVPVFVRCFGWGHDLRALLQHWYTQSITKKKATKDTACHKNDSSALPHAQIILSLVECQTVAEGRSVPLSLQPHTGLVLKPFSPHIHPTQPSPHTSTRIIFHPHKFPAENLHPSSLHTYQG